MPGMGVRSTFSAASVRGDCFLCSSPQGSLSVLGSLLLADQCFPLHVATTGPRVYGASQALWKALDSASPTPLSTPKVRKLSAWPAVCHLATF